MPPAPPGAAALSIEPLVDHLLGVVPAVLDCERDVLNKRFQKRDTAEKLKQFVSETVTQVN